MCSRVLDGRGHPVDAALEPADLRSPGWRSRMPPKMYLPNMSRNGATDWSIPMLDGVELVRRRRRALADVVRDRDLRLFDRIPHAVHGGAREVDRTLVLGPCPGDSGIRKVFKPSALSSPTRPAGALRIPPVDEADAEDAVVRSLLDLSDVLVVDPEAELADLPVRPAEQGEDRSSGRPAPGTRPRSRARPDARRRRPCASRRTGRTA